MKMLCINFTEIFSQSQEFILEVPVFDIVLEYNIPEALILLRLFLTFGKI